jgi:hypothetical protein
MTAAARQKDAFFSVIPAHAGIQGGCKDFTNTSTGRSIARVALDSRLRGNDDQVKPDARTLGAIREASAPVPS